MIIAILLSRWYGSLIVDPNDGERRELENRMSWRKSRGFCVPVALEGSQERSEAVQPPLLNSQPHSLGISLLRILS
jgi:hypothetical protein